MMLANGTERSIPLFHPLLPFLFNASMGFSHQGPLDMNRGDNADAPLGFESFAKASDRFTSFMRDL